MGGLHGVGAAAEAGPKSSSALLGVPIPPVSREVSLQATQWMVELAEQDPGSPAWGAFRQWHDAQPEHAAAWAHVARFAEHLRSHGQAGQHDPHAALLGQALKAQIQKDESGRTRKPRRQALKLLALAAFSSTATWEVLRRTGQWDQWVADYSTATGEQRQWTLADGAQVILNTDTALNVHYTAQQRLLQLKRGEILVTTASHLRTASASPDTRPFWVQTPQGRLQALGTRFTVRIHNDHTHLGVLDGMVQAHSRDADAAQVVTAGQQLRLTRTKQGTVMAFSEAQAAWTSGSIIAHDMPLPAFIAELARYRAGHLACDASAAHLRVSGIYAVADTDKVLLSLQRNLPIEVQRRTDYWVTVVLRAV